MAILYSALSDVGRVREHNEDTYLVDRKLHLYIVCDGMGGHKGGEVASATAVNLVRDGVMRYTDILEAARNSDDGVDSNLDLHAALTKIVRETSRRIYEMGLSEPDRRGMGTTLSLMLLVGKRAYTAHVGDSRIYRRRNQETAQITEDHSLYNAMVRQGSRQEADAMAGRLKNAVTRAVGVEEELEVDTEEIILQSGDRFLLCSDGLSGYFEDGDVDRLMSINDVESAVAIMINHANERGGRDNITAVLIEIPHADDGANNVDEQVVSTLTNTALESALNPTELKTLGLEFTRTSYEAGEVVLAGGSDDRAMLVVLDGSLDVVDGSTIIQCLKAGEIFESLTQPVNGPATMTLVANAETAAAVARISADTIDRLAGDNPVLYGRFQYGLAKVVAMRLADAAKCLDEPMRTYVVPSAESLGSLERAPIAPMGTESTQPAAAIILDDDDAETNAHPPTDVAGMDSETKPKVDDTMPTLNLGPEDMEKQAIPTLDSPKVPEQTGED